MARTIVITGTRSGLGFATVEKFAKEGWNVVATTRDGTDPFGHLSSVAVLPLDVDDAAAVESFGTRAADEFGTVDVLVNNAGFTRWGPWRRPRWTKFARSSRPTSSD